MHNNKELVMNTIARRIRTGIVVLLLAAPPGAFAWEVGFSGQDPGNTDPGFDGDPSTPLNDPWSSTLSVPNQPGTKFWVAIQNLHIAVNSKTVTVTLTKPPDNDFKCNDVAGYYNSGNTQSTWVGNRVEKKDNGDGTVTFTATLDPQPDWEVLEIEITGGKSGADGGEYVPEAEGHSNCVQVHPYGWGVDILDGMHDGLGDLADIREVVIFPETATFDPGSDPFFEVVTHPGPWMWEPVLVDPYGGPQPQGGVRFFTDGLGIQTREDTFNCNIYLFATENPEEWYWMYMYDNSAGRWQVYLLGANLCPEDLDGDGVVGLSDLATLLAAYGLSAGDPGFLPAADFDHDGHIGLPDLATLLAVYGTTCP
jgi:hypothetical protein